VTPTEQHVTIPTADGPMPAFAAAPAGAARGGIVVVQEAFGVTPHIEDIARRLAAAGWSAVAPALFHRQGSPVMAYDDFDAVMPAMGQLNAEGITMDVAAAMHHLAAAGFAPDRTGAVGFCMGGSVTLHAAATQPFGAAVTYYGGGLTEGRFGFPPLLELAPALQTPWLGLFGDRDQGIPVEAVEELRTATAQASVPSEIVRYADADHGFNCNDRPNAFNAEAAADAWERTLGWFDRYLVKAD
jgi:carboxymethylenebutenolidase